MGVGQHVIIPTAPSPVSTGARSIAMHRARKSESLPVADLELNSQSLEFVERLYAEFVNDPASVPADWRQYFQKLPRGNGRGPVKLGPSFPRRSLFAPPAADGRKPAPAVARDTAAFQERVDQLIRNYRVRGHIVARVDPLNQPTAEPPELDPAFYGFTEEDFDRPISTVTDRGPDVRTLRTILQRLKNTYCWHIGVQFMHIDSLTVRLWLQDRMESAQNRLRLERAEQFRILRKLSDAVVFEEFLQKKFTGAKSFSLEGAESLIPLLDLAIEKAGEDGVEEIVLGMAHRGRLNVLANVMGKSPAAIFREFEDLDHALHTGRGDVKYHLGHSSDWETASGRIIHLSLCFNPSHLEYVNPVALGRTRAKQDRFGDLERERSMTLLIHGDAAFAGEGIVQETLNLSELPGYRTGGTIHVIVNNQLGFTTSPGEGRSSVYATDVAKMLQIPIFHVNGEHPEAVAQVVRLAMDFRRKFQRDVVIDMYCFRLRGHNEGDEPAFTQPVMYQAIRERESVRHNYLEHLIMLGEVTTDEAERIVDERRELLERELATARSEEYVYRPDLLGGFWEGFLGGHEADVPEVETGVAADRLADLLLKQTVVPENFTPHRKIERGMETRRAMARGERPLDWSAAESLAFASLVTEGIRVRMSGQDSARGTFSQRHAVLHDAETGEAYMPLAHLAEDQGPIEIINSPLSEAGVMGFEYGYSLDCPEGLVLWEAQFGDFVNAAQVIIDQYLAAAEDKWRRLSGLVLLLPHGFEGQGPEHSSARLERFLTLAAEDNMQIAYPTTPAQYFHLLRRQVLRPWRKPLVVMTPKSLLRHREAASSVEDCATGTFRRVVPDDSQIPAETVNRILLCTGKVYYDLRAKREELGRSDVAIVRVEQLYPFPDEPLRKALAAYRDGAPAWWVQEEPENMGAWRFLRVRFGNSLFERLPLAGVSRRASASPATGSAASHRLEQEELVAHAFGGS
ncbi:MAG: 2-oxoglutarate dehydrogenase E1 component [Planctomycetales bacterium]